MNSPPLETLTNHRRAVNASWLLRLRWAAVIGQVATIAVTTTVLGVDLQLPPLITIVGLTAVTNALAARSLRDQVRREEGPLFGPTGDRWLATLMALDMLSLTGLLYYTGGPENPFTMFYFVNLALSAVVLPAVWSWLLTSLAVSASIGLFFVHVELPELRDANQSEMSIREIGFLVALAGCAVVVVHFITRVTTALHLREAQLREAEEKRQASRRLDSLATLAAGAGHELASPLSTIAVVAKELSMHLEGVDVPETVVRDVALIRSELDHCRLILNRLSGWAGHAVAEGMTSTPVGVIVEEVVVGLRTQETVAVQLDDQTADLTLITPLEALAQAIRGLVQNAIDASPAGELVDLSVRADDSEIVFVVRDRGEGMSPQTLDRLGEPFFTTKEVGQGMGLGVFLSRNVIELLGGRLEFSSELAVGTAVEVRLQRQLEREG